MKNEEYIEVSIFGEEYRLISNNDDERIKKIAKIVDEKMKSAANRYPNYSKLKVAVLVALNLADDVLEYYENKSDISNIITTLCEKIDELLP